MATMNRPPTSRRSNSPRAMARLETASNLFVNNAGEGAFVDTRSIQHHDPLVYEAMGEENKESIKKHGVSFNKWEQGVVAESGIDIETYCKDVQQRLDGQEFFDDPHSSIWANVFSSLVLLCILISTTTLCIETLAVFQDDKSKQDLFVVETICVIVFTIEYVFRLALAYRRLQFVTQIMNVVDLVAIVPYYITLVLLVVFDKSADELASLGVLRLIRLVRVFRILKLARNMPTLKLIVMAVLESASSLTLMIFILVVMLIVFGAFEYFFERGNAWCSDWTKDTKDECVGYFTDLAGQNATRIWEDSPWRRKRCGSGYNGLPSDPNNCSLSPFLSIPEAMWWCLVTLLTVGYGDIYPISVGGKLVAALAMVVSVVILALPISIIGTNFVENWVVEEEHAHRKKDPVALSNSAKTTQQSLLLFVKTLKYNIEKSEGLKRSVIHSLASIGSATPEEAKKRPIAARQAKLYCLKAAEQQLYVLRTKNLRLLPLEDADVMVNMAREVAPSREADDTARLMIEAKNLRKAFDEERPEASLLKVLRRSRENGQWFSLMQTENEELLKDLAAMRKILDVEPGQHDDLDPDPEEPLEEKE